MIKTRFTAIAFAFGMSLASSFAQGITFKTDATTGEISELSINNDAYYKNDDSRKSYDCNEGRERVGMGVMLAKWYLKHPSEKLKQSLIRYADFYHNKLQTEDFTTYSRVTKDGWNRGYNYAWAADFFFHMYEVTKNRKYAFWDTRRCKLSIITRAMASTASTSLSLQA